MTENELAKATPQEQVAYILGQAKDYINDILSEDIHGMLLLSVNADLDKLTNRVKFLAGIPVNTSKAQEFPPVPESADVKQLTQEDIDPAEADREAYLAKVEKLFTNIASMEVNEVLKSYTHADDVLVLRGVAKRAGVPGYDEREINSVFVEEVILGVIERQEDANREQEIENTKQTGDQLKNIDDALGTSGQTADQQQAAISNLGKWNKEALQAELTKRSITFDPDATNKALVELLKNAMTNDKPEQQ